MIYLYIYLIIGFFIGLGYAIYNRSIYNSAKPINQFLMHHKYGCAHWIFYVVMILSRMIAWPGYLIAEFLAKSSK